MTVFQFTQPKRAATSSCSPPRSLTMFQFTQPKRAATAYGEHHKVAFFVSIHAAQAGCDGRGLSRPLVCLGFNSRSPSGLRQALQSIQAATDGFNSRSPSELRRQTSLIRNDGTSFNSRSPSGLRHKVDAYEQETSLVSIHAAQAGCDWVERAATADEDVSIHAAQAGCDLVCSTGRIGRLLFQFTQPKRAATQS